MTATDNQPPAKRQFPLRSVIAGITMLAVLGVLFLILVPNVNSPESYRASKKAISTALLNNLAQASRLYESEYKLWPTLSTEPPGKDFVLRLKQQSPAFVEVMSGDARGALKPFNKSNIPFLTLSDDQLSPDGKYIVDSFGNDDIVLILDTDGDGQIAPFTQTLTAKNGRTVTIRQTLPVHDRVIAMSPGDGKTDASAVTTWTVKQYSE